jgi:HD-like signal output (HDOD) protein
MQTEHTIVDLVRNKDTQLPTLPVVVDKILNVTSSEKTSARDLADIIARDQAIANKTLRLANSSYYGFAKEIDTISRAVAMIGFDEIISLVLGIGVLSAFQQKSTHDLLDMQELWIHAIGCATATKRITRGKTTQMNEQLFLAGLLHDMGKVIFSIYFPDEYRAALKQAAAQKIPLFKAERDIFGLDHAALGGMLTERWNFPDAILMLIRYHHDPGSCPLEHQQQTLCIELADFLCHQAKIGSSGTPEVRSPALILKDSGVTPSELQRLVGELKQERKEIEDFFRIIR